MKYCLLLIICFLIFSYPVSAQTSYTYINTDVLDKYGEVEISSICCQNDKFYLPAERKDSLFVGTIVNDKLQLDDPIDIKGLNPNAEIEGAFIKGKTIFLVDEHNAYIYAYKLKKGNAKKVKFKGFNSHSYKSKEEEGNEFGFEGIAYNKKKNLLFLLCERSSLYNEMSELHVFTKKWYKKRKLTHKNSFLITRGDMRYTDLYYDKSSNAIYLLKTKECKYQIEKIVMRKNGKVPKSINTIPIIDFSSEVNAKVSTYNTNLEGIIVKDSHIYIISDIGGGKSTFFLRMKLPSTR